MRAPVAPIGCPRAHAPPLTFTLACSRDRSFIAAMGTAAKASLISYRSTSFACQFNCASSFLIAPTGAKVNHSGSRAKLAYPRIRAKGFKLLAAANDSRANTTAAAPSEMDEEPPPVPVAVFLKGGFNLGNLGDTESKGCLALTHAPPPLASFRRYR